MHRPPSIRRQLRRARAHDHRERKLAAAAGDLGTFVRLNFEELHEEYVDCGGRWPEIAARLGRAFPKLRTRGNKPVAAAPADLKKAFHRERQDREARAGHERHLLGLAAVRPGFRPAVVPDKPRPSADPGKTISPLDDEDALVPPSFTALKRRAEGRG